MKRKDRDEDIAERRARYQAGLMQLSSAVRGFKELTGVDLLDAVDTSGRHMGEPPYLKITAERLREITTRLEADVAQADEFLGSIMVEVPQEPAQVFEFSAYRPSVKR